jgi:hypothetical protein
MYTTPGAKGKFYAPVKVDRRAMGARKRHLSSKYSKEMSSSTRRNTFKGYSELSGLSRGIAENKETIYDRDEEKLLESNEEIKKMIIKMSTAGIDSLEKDENDKPKIKSLREMKEEAKKETKKNEKKSS